MSLLVLAILLGSQCVGSKAEHFPWSYTNGSGNSNSKHCMTSCQIEKDGYYKCYTAAHCTWCFWEPQEICTPGGPESQVRLPDGDDCYSLCEDPDGGNNEVCSISGDYAAGTKYCSTRRVAVAWTSDHKNLCMDDCVDGRCQITNTEFANCEPSLLNVEAVYPNNQYYGRCVTHCGKFGEKYNWCKVQKPHFFSYSWDYCSNDHVEKAFKDFISPNNKYSKDSFHLSAVNTVPCTSRTSVTTLPTGAVNNRINLQRLFAPRENFQLPSFESPVTFFHESMHNGVIRTNFIKAKIFRHHSGRVRRSLATAIINRRMVDLNSNKNTNDVRGHLLASSLGGNESPYNIVPQSQEFNSAEKGQSLSKWRQIEIELATTLLSFEDNDKSFIDWNLFITYLPHSNRPYLYWLQYTIQRFVGNVPQQPEVFPDLQMCDDVVYLNQCF